MKATIFLLLAISPLFFVPVFAIEITNMEDISIPKYSTGSETVPLNNANNLIRDLNVEFDRLSSNGYTHEDYDLLSDFWTNLVINAVLPLDRSSLSDTEVREYLMEQSYIVDELEEYATGLGNDTERVTFFHNAAVYANELIYAD